MEENVKINSNDFEVTKYKRKNESHFNNNIIDLFVIEIDYEQDQDLKWGKIIYNLQCLDVKNQQCKFTISNFHCFLYAEFHNEITANQMQNLLNEYFENSFLKVKVFGVEIHRKSQIQQQKEEEIKSYQKIQVNDLEACRNVKGYLESEFQFNNSKVPLQCQETDIPQVIRLINEVQITGFKWIQIDNMSGKSKFDTDIPWQNIKILPIEDYADLRIICFDIECLPPEDLTFPQAKTDPIITIGIVCSSLYKLPAAEHRLVFQLGETKQLSNSSIVEFQDEVTMLRSFKDFIMNQDPDLISGFNSIRFDMKYLLDRARQLGIRGFEQFSRNIRKKCEVKDKLVYNVKIQGYADHSQLVCAGRLKFDLRSFVIKQTNWTLQSYSLNQISSLYLSEVKDDIKISQLRHLYLSGPQGRTLIAKYCLKDSWLVLLLIDKLKAIECTIENIRINNMFYSFEQGKGQILKLYSIILKFCKEGDVIVPDNIGKSNQDTNKFKKNQFEAGPIIDNFQGLKDEPIVVLDQVNFQPSIIEGQNMCYSTLINSENPLPPSLFQKVDEEIQFVIKSRKLGIIPTLIETFIKNRDLSKQQVDALQLRLNQQGLGGKEIKAIEAKIFILKSKMENYKFVSNCIFGFIGCRQSPIHEVRVSKSVTRMARNILLRTKAFIEKCFNKDNNFKNNAQILYGDTDSVFISFGTHDVNTALELASNAVDLVNKFLKLPKPIVIRLDHVQNPIVFITRRSQFGYKLPLTPDNKIISESKTIVKKGKDLNRSVYGQFIHLFADLIIEKLLFHKDIEGSKKLLSQVIHQILEDKLDISLFISSNQYQEFEWSENTTTQKFQPDQVVAFKRQQRDPTVQFRNGDRISWVITPGQFMSAPERAEDPMYVMENDAKVDYVQQLKHKFQDAMKVIFEPVIGLQEYKYLYDFSMHKHEQQKQLREYYDSKNIKQCKFCHVSLKNDEQRCGNCQKNQYIHIASAQLDIFRLRREYSQLWSHCMTCQDKFQMPVDCQNKECPIIQRRCKIKQELEKESQIFNSNELVNALDW